MDEERELDETWEPDRLSFAARPVVQPSPHFAFIGVLPGLFVPMALGLGEPWAWVAIAVSVLFVVLAAVGFAARTAWRTRYARIAIHLRRRPPPSGPCLKRAERCRPTA